MRCLLLLGLLMPGMIAASPALAQQEFPAAAIDKEARLLDEKKTRYLLRQIDLSAEQAAHAQGLIESIHTGDADTADINPDDVREIWAKLEKAKEANDQEKVDALTEQLKQIGHRAAGDSDVFANLEPQLTDEQKKKLEQARVRLERVPSGALRPIDLIRTARSFDLTAQQERKLLEVSLATREMLGPILRPNTDLKLRMVSFLAGEIRTLLTPEQVAQFELRVRALRPDLADEGLLVRMPAALPDEQPPDDEARPDRD